MTLFPNANNTQITGGQFIIVNQRTASLQGLDLLREHCAFGALLDSNERFDPPRCTAETREALIKEILAWIHGGGDSASMAWLFGGAGAGKSALAQTIAEIFQREGKLAGSFFFSRTSTAERSDGNRLIPTLVLQLLEAFPDLKSNVAETIDRHEMLFERSPRTHMDLLFIKPLMTLKQHALPVQISPLDFVPSTSTLSPTILPITPKSKTRHHRFSKVIGKLTRNFEGPLSISPLQSKALSPDTGIPTKISSPSQPRLIIIDGLDECRGEDVQIDLLRVLASAIPRLSFPLRILITSRPEGGITRTINHDKSFRNLDVRKIDLSSDANANADIQIFLTKGFQEICETHPLRSLLDPAWPSGHVIRILVQKSSSHFIYASTVIKYIQYPRGRPDERLEIILGLSVPPTTDKPFAQLDALYTYIFMCIDETDRVNINHALGLLHLASQNTLEYDVGTSPAELDDYLGMRAGGINLLFEPLLSLVALPEDRGAMIKVLHASLFDFLLDETRSAACILTSKWLMDCLQITGSSMYRHIHTNLADGPHLHSVHATQVEQRLDSIRGGCDPHPLEDSTQEPLFNDIAYQDRHRVYSSLLKVYVSLHGIESLHKILHDCRYMSNSADAKNNVLWHFLVICLPHLSSKSIDLCQEYSEYPRDSDDELRRVLRHRVLEYLQRVGQDLHKIKLGRCKAAWGID